MDWYSPRPRIRSHLRGIPHLASVVSLSTDLDISRQAAARRYVECHGETLAVVFSRDRRLIYSERSKDFPALALRKAIPLPDLPGPSDDSGLTSIENTAADEWLASPDGVEVAVQTLHQQKGHAITLVRIVSTEEDEDDGGIDDTYEQFKRLGG